MSDRKIRMRAELKYTLEYDADPEDYGVDPDDPDVEKLMIAIDERNIRQEGGEWIWDSRDTDTEWSVEVLR
jgi:hypothetical protein